MEEDADKENETRALLTRFDGEGEGEGEGRRIKRQRGKGNKEEKPGER